MAMRKNVPLLKRAGSEFVRNLAWMLGVFGALAAILVFATNLPLTAVLVFGVISVSVMATIVTVVVLLSGAHDETLLSGHNYPGVPHEGGGLDHWDGGGGDFGRGDGGGGGGDSG
jgi:hypothetical protein